MRTCACLAALLLVSACKKKEETPAAAKGPQITASIPDSPEARQFAKKLISAEVSGLNPTGSSDLSMTIHFKGDGSWTSVGHAELGGETLDCDEVGSWEIDQMEGAKAVMNWTITKTTCPNRENNQAQRVQMEFTDTTYKVSFR